MFRRLIALAVVPVLAAGCAAGLHFQTEVENPAPLIDAAARQAAEAAGDSAVAALPRVTRDGVRPPYQIGPLDEIALLVSGRPDLGSQLPQPGGDRRVSPVAADGAITLPLLGRITVAGQTPAQLRTSVQTQYARLVTAPMVEVEMVAFRSQGVRVEGEAVHPGRIYLSEEISTLGDVLAAAGGTTADADTRHIVLERSGRSFHLDLQRSGARRGDQERILLRADDRLYIPAIQEQIVYVFGEVGRQGTVPIPARGLTILEALAQAQGPSVTSAETEHLYLVRPTRNDSTVYRLDMARLVNSEDVEMAAGDRLYVPPTRLASLSRVFTDILPYFYIITTALLIGRDIARK